jgi:hypothetical protein
MAGPHINRLGFRRLAHHGNKLLAVAATIVVCDGIEKAVDGLPWSLWS